VISSWGGSAYASETPAVQFEGVGNFQGTTPSPSADDAGVVAVNETRSWPVVDVDTTGTDYATQVRTVMVRVSTWALYEQLDPDVPVPGGFVTGMLVREAVGT
jgi:hypothetical protein